MIKVLVADDNVELNMTLSKYLAKEKDIKVVDMTLDGEETINSYSINNPDVLVLDMNMPKKNGIEILTDLNQLNEQEKNKCNVIILSGSFSNFMPEIANKVFRIYTKPCEFKTILNSVREIYKNNTVIMPNYKEICENLFLKLGFNLSSKGCELLIKSIVMLIESKTVSFSMYDVYKNLSAQENIPALKIKWNIEKSIDSMFRYCDNHTLKNVFPEYDERKPTPKYIIGLTLHKLRYLN